MTDVLDRLTDADPLRTLTPPDPDALDGLRRAVLATPRPRSRARRAAPRRGRRLALAAALVLGASATAAAAAGRIDWDDVLPGGDTPPGEPAPLVEVSDLDDEAGVVATAVADPPGLTTPRADVDPDGDVGGGEVGAGASQQLSLEQCTWQRAVLDAHAAGDAAAERRARQELGREIWYRYVADEEGRAWLRAVNTDPARLADLQQTWDVNCPGGAYDRTVHPDAPPIGR
jgi:hypothetical protein